VLLSKRKSRTVTTPSDFVVPIVKLETTKFKLRDTDEYPQTLANILWIWRLSIVSVFWRHTRML